MGRGIFDIDIYKLADDTHSFEFDFDSSFFELFEDRLIEEGKGKIKVLLDKSALLLTLVFDIDAIVELVCDRSLEKFNYQINVNKEIRIKYGDHAEELNEDLYLISAKTQKIDIGKFAYEFITIAIPMKKLHPRLQEDADEGIIYSSSEADLESLNNDIDPRWNELKKINKN